MQVVGAGALADAGAIPTALWEGPTARIIERRNHDRRQGRPIEATAVTPRPEPTPARNMVIGVSLLTFACGVAVATAANRLPRSESRRLAQIEQRQPAATTPAAAAAIVVQPLTKPAEEPTPDPAARAASSPAAAARFADPPVIAKAAPPPRAVAARVARPRRAATTAAVRAADLEADDPFEAAHARAPGHKWVDPFAE